MTILTSSEKAAAAILDARGGAAEREAKAHCVPGKVGQAVAADAADAVVERKARGGLCGGHRVPDTAVHAACKRGRLAGVVDPEVKNGAAAERKGARGERAARVC